MPPKKTSKESDDKNAPEKKKKKNEAPPKKARATKKEEKKKPGFIKRTAVSAGAKAEKFLENALKNPTHLEGQINVFKETIDDVPAF